MSDQSDILLNAPLSRAEDRRLALPADQEHHERVNIVRLLHRNLRGRYFWAISLSLAGACVGALVGYLTPTPRYRAEAVIRVQPVLPKILYQNEESSLQPMFTSFVNTQANLIQNPRVIFNAMSSPAWRDLHRAGKFDEDAFRRQLGVTTSALAPELIFVSFSDREAQAALVGVQEVILAYQELWGGAESKKARKVQVDTLTARRQTLESQKTDLEKKIASKAGEFESPDLERLSEHYLTQLLPLEQRVTQLEIRLTELGLDLDALPEPKAGETPAGKPEEKEPPSPEEIAVTDRAMAKALEERTELRRKLEKLRSTGMTSQHRQYQQIIQQLEALDAEIQDLVAKWTPPATADAPAADTGDARLKPAELTERYRRLKKQAEDLKKRAEKVHGTQLEIDALRAEVKTKQEQLDETTKRLDQINVESQVQESSLLGRIQVLSLPDTPPSVPRDDPRLKFSAAGMLLGGLFPLGVFFVLGAADRRLRYADQADAGRGVAPMLGVLPLLPANPADPSWSEQTSNAAHCVHHIRTRLQLSDRPRKVYAVTSPTSGDGKTSLSLSLALSYVSAGNRTLLIDFDLFGHALTRQIGLSRPRGLGFHLVKPEGPPEVVPTRIPGLSVIPAGREDAACHNRVSRRAFEELLDQVRDRFDAIIIDTGPILGSLEAPIAATAADGVVLVIGRGQDGSRVASALDQLRILGADVVGIVFNRAQAADFYRSTLISASFRSVRPGEPQGPPTARRAPDPGFADLDPLARSVVEELDPKEPAP